jgi:hypothetical protein
MGVVCKYRRRRREQEGRENGKRKSVKKSWKGEGRAKTRKTEAA